MNYFRKDNQPSKKIKIKHFIEFCSNTDNKCVVRDEYDALNNDRSIPWDQDEFKKFVTKNRYQDILPYRHNRVLLVPNEYCNSDYINASYITGYKQKDKYIAAQDPLPNTVYDFWYMIMLHNCRRIVMLTQMCNETSRKYYPDRNGVLQFKDIKVLNVKQTNYKYFMRRVLLVSSGRKYLLILHYHLLTWINPNVIGCKLELMDFIRFIRSECVPTTKILVHSSSGIGRTGVFIALDILIDQVWNKKYVNIYKTVKHLKQERVRMICSIEQYQFVYEMLVTYLKHTKSRKIKLYKS